MRNKYPTDTMVADHYTRIVEAVASIPGVAHAGLVNRLPLAGGQTMSSIAERSDGSQVDLGFIDSRPVTPDYFAALGISIRKGRVFGEHDNFNAPIVSIIDDVTAKTTWPDGDAIGRRVQTPNGEWSTIVGVVSRVHNEGVDIEPRPQIYWSYRQLVQDRMALVVRTSGDAAAIIAPVRRAIRDIDPDQALYDVQTMSTVVERSLAQRTMVTTLIAAFGAVALLLASVGVYGVIAYGVTQRLREFGIRIALGATRSGVLRMVVGQGVSTATIGAAIGLVVALGFSGVISSMVYGVAPRDVVSIAGALVIMLLVALVASYIPARRASSVDPAEALRNE
jgi:putative ABC transport system permease protein